MEDVLARIWENIVARPEGPMRFRFLLQPLMGIILAFLDGRRDARAGRPPWGWAAIHDVGHRRDLLLNGWKSVSKLFFVAIALDLIYQFVVHRFERFYPGETLVVAFLLALVPYALMRGPANRLCRLFGRGK